MYDVLQELKDQCQMESNIAEINVTVVKMFLV